jgi:D-alanine-D-alanine ligase
MRVAVLSNDDEGLAHGRPEDAIAARGVDEQAEAVAAACREEGFEVVRVLATRDVGRFLRDLDEARADVAFNLIEAIGGEARLEAAAAGLLEWVGLPYTGSPPRAMSLALEKPLARAAMAAAGLPVPRGLVMERGDEDVSDLPFPAIVKPSREDASHGIGADSVVRDRRALGERVRWVVETYEQPALVEEYVDGRELNVAILGSGAGARALPVSEIDFSEFLAGRPRIVTYEGKWVEGSADYGRTNPFFPDLEPALLARVQEVALAAYRLVGVRDYGRVDLRVDARRGPLVLEVNPNPDVSPEAGLARSVRRAGIEYRAFVRRTLEAALERARHASAASGR